MLLYMQLYVHVYCFQSVTLTFVILICHSYIWRSRQKMSFPFKKGYVISSIPPFTISFLPTQYYWQNPCEGLTE